MDDMSFDYQLLNNKSGLIFINRSNYFVLF